MGHVALGMLLCLLGGQEASTPRKGGDLTISSPDLAKPVILTHAELSKLPRKTVRVAGGEVRGQAPEPFDWSQRPFFLRFGEDNSEEVAAAWEELRRRTGL